MHKSILTLLLCLGLAAGQPVVSFPFNAQLPPVARTGSLFTYTFSPHTFQSDLNLTYKLGKHPSWLSLEGSERRLYGIPDGKDLPAGDVVGQSVEIIATDDTGSVTMDSTIVVCRDPGPSIKIPISEQIKRFGDYSAPSSVLSYPSTSFIYQFDQNTFQHEPDMINYYATSGNSSPLPAWIRFDAPSMTFSGSTPGADALFQPPQTFDIRLVASDIQGFSSTSIDFSIVVSANKLTAENPVIELNASRGSSFEYNELADGIKLNNEPVQPGDVNVTTTNMPSWLSFDPDTWAIKGKPEKDDHSANFSLSFSDPFSDKLNVWATVNVATKLFESTFHDIEATPGEDFTMDLRPHFKEPSDIDVKVHTQPDQKWLKLDGFRLKGKVPKSASGEVEVGVEARSKSTGAKETETLTMTFLAPDGSTTTTPTTRVPTTSATSHGDGAKKDDDDDDDDDGGGGGIGTTAILLATIIPILFVALVVLLVVCLIKRRRQRRSYLSEEFRSKISHPIVGTLRVNETGNDPEKVQGKNAKTMPVFYSEKEAYAHGISGRSSSRSSNTAGTLSHDVSEAYMHNAGPEASGVGSSGSDDGAESWFTEDRTMTAARSEASPSRNSEVTVPHSTHQLLPTPPLLPQPEGTGFRSGLDLTIPTLDELPNMNPTPHGTSSYQARTRSEAMYSTMTTSSAALPMSGHESLRANPVPFAAAASAVPGRKKSSDKSSSEKDWCTIREDEPEDPVPDLPPPGLALLSNRQMLSRRASDRESFLSETSFGSTENWRVIGRPEQSVPNLSYKDLVEESPFYLKKGESPAPSVVGRADGEQQMRPATEPASAPSPMRQSITAVPSEPQRLGVAAGTSRSQFSTVNEEGSDLSRPATGTTVSRPGTSSNWQREASGEYSEGSFKVFL